MYEKKHFRTIFKIPIILNYQKISLCLAEMIKPQRLLESNIIFHFLLGVTYKLKDDINILFQNRLISISQLVQSIGNDILHKQQHE